MGMIQEIHDELERRKHAPLPPPLNLEPPRERSSLLRRYAWFLAFFLLFNAIGMVLRYGFY